MPIIVLDQLVLLFSLRKPAGFCTVRIACLQLISFVLIVLNSVVLQDLCSRIEVGLCYFLLENIFHTSFYFSMKLFIRSIEKEVIRHEYGCVTLEHNITG